MTGGYTVRGVPRGLLRDAWRMSVADGASAPPPPVEQNGVGARPGPSRLLVLAVLVLLADVLFFRQSVGLSLALFGLALFAVVWVTQGTAPDRAAEPSLAIAVLAVLPAVEMVQPLSVAILVAGVSVAAIRLTLGPGTAGAVLTRLCRFAGFVPLAAGQDLMASRKQIQRPGLSLEAVLRAWAFPAAVGAVFLGLLASANPLLDGLLADILQSPRHLGSVIERLVFWSAMAALAWPFVALARHRARLSAPLTVLKAELPAAGFGINATSMANSLIVFNLMFLIQTGLDVAYLWGGAPMPVGMSYAEYAHRGAYPLILTALLAGVFALIARPFADRPALRALLLLWIAQNLLLTVSAIYRLELYVAAYGLTYLRLYAAIWIALVAAGLALTAWQVLRRRSNLWLTLRVGALALVTLYGASFVNFAHVIAATNLSAAREGATQPLDTAYLCRLGRTAQAAIRAHEVAAGVRLCHGPLAYGPVIEGWRDWGFRKWRVRRYLSETPAPWALNTEPRA